MLTYCLDIRQLTELFVPVKNYDCEYGKNMKTAILENWTGEILTFSFHIFFLFKKFSLRSSFQIIKLSSDLFIFAKNFTVPTVCTVGTYRCTYVRTNSKYNMYSV